VAIYGEVTGTLRYHCFAMKKVFPNAELLMACRDGREVVRSVMGMPHYTEGSKGAFNITPSPDESIAKQWPNMDRFEKICWSWAHSYRVLLECIPPHKIVHFEQIIKDYDYFLEKVVKPTDIFISQEKWGRKFDEKSKNSSQTFIFPRWKEWNQKEKESFDRICGEVMHQLGYDYHW
jgi:hypothetical protein